MADGCGCCNRTLACKSCADCGPRYRRNRRRFGPPLPPRKCLDSVLYQWRLSPERRELLYLPRGGVVTTLGIVGYIALSSVEHAAEGWRERQGTSLAGADGWQLETFQQFFSEVRNSKLEDLSNVPDPIANGGNRLPLTKPESLKLAARFYQDATWQRLGLDRAPLRSEWPKSPAPSTIPIEPGEVTQLPAENPALFAAIENSTRVAAQNALESVRSRAADFRTALIAMVLLFQAVAWLASSVSATRDIGGN